MKYKSKRDRLRQQVADKRKSEGKWNKVTVPASRRKRKQRNKVNETTPLLVENDIISLD